MNNFDLDFIGDEKLKHLYEVYTEDNYEYSASNFDEDIDNTKGWSYVCLGEVINYYMNQN